MQGPILTDGCYILKVIIHPAILLVGRWKEQNLLKWDFFAIFRPLYTRTCLFENTLMRANLCDTKRY